MPPSARTFETWNRRIHFYLGLYFLFFIWLFSLSGLLLNHGDWRMAVEANTRRETRDVRTLDSLAGETNDARAHDVMRQLGLTGELSWPAMQQPGIFAFQVSRPTDSTQVRLNVEQRLASVQHFENNTPGAFRAFHTFSGSRYNDTAQRDWVMTTAWVVAMDALAAGLIVMTIGGYYMWYRLKPKRALGVIALAAGFLGCALFLAGLSYT